MRVVWLLTMTVMLWAAGASAWAQASAETHVFDLPALPLEQALRRYGEITGLSIFFDTEQVRGKRSPSVRGRYARTEGLSRLLKGTQMRAQSVSSGVVTVVPLEAEAPAPDRGNVLALSYDGYLQQSILHVLCAQPGLQADRLRIALRFSINKDRRVEDLRVRVQARPELEPVVRQALSQARLRPPPAGLAQPMILLVSPQAAARWGGCQR
jgi:hypothetical protein